MNKHKVLTVVSNSTTGAAPATHGTPGRAKRPVARAPRRSALGLALVALLGIGPMTPAQAVTWTWTGLVPGIWSNPNNWRNGSSPGVPQNSDNLIFNNSARPTQVVDISPFLNSITFAAGAGAFTFNPSSSTVALTHLGNITNNSANLQTFNVPLLANGSGQQNWDGGTAGLVLSNAWLTEAPAYNNVLALISKVALTYGDAVLGGEATATSLLHVLAGSSATTGALTLGRDYGSQGTVRVDGTASKLTSTGDLVIGASGIGILTVQNSSSAIASTTLTLGRDFGSQGTVLVDGAASQLKSTGDLVIGHASTGTLTVQNGGVLNSGNTFIGKVLGGDGLAVVSGPTAKWLSTGNLNIGDAGVGSLRVEAGGTVNAVGAAFGSLDGSAGTATVTGANSSWVLGGDLKIGSVGQGTLFIEAGGRVSNSQATVGQVGDAGNSMVLVTGAGSQWQNSGSLVIHSGSLELAAGGVVSATNYVFGQPAGSAALVTLDGAGSTLTVTNTLHIGSLPGTTSLNAGAATVNLGKGATINTGSQLVIGNGGVLNLNGGTLITGWSLNEGQVNWNTGTVQFQGSVASGSGILDHSVGLGPDMNMVVQGELTIFAGDGLSLNGGQVQTNSLILAGDLSVGSFSQFSAGAGGISNTGSVLLAGGTLSSDGAMWNANYLAGYGVIAGTGGFSNTGLLQQFGGSLNLAAKGSNVNTGNWVMQDGRGLQLTGGDLLNAGVMSLNGDTISGTATLVNGSTGTLSGRGAITSMFQNDGRLTVDAGLFRIDRAFASTGQILLSSAAATLSGNTVSNSGRIYGQGQVNNAIVNTGTVAAVGGMLTLAGHLTNNGIVSAGTGATVLVNQGLAVNTGKIQLAGGTFDNNGKPMTNQVGAVINGFGTLSGGLLTNKGQVQLSGGSSTVNADVLSTSASRIILSGNSNTTFYGNVDVQAGAELRVSTGSVATFFGTVQQRTGSLFTGNGAKRFEGTLSVGASPGLGTDEGDVEFGNASAYLAEIGGTTACTLRCGTDEAFKHSSYDKYIVAGNLSLNGTLKLVSWNGFTGSAGQSFDLLDWGTLSGTFANIDATGFQLAAGTQLDYSQLYTSGVISVTVAAVPEPGTYALFLGGLLTLGCLARRRLNAAAG